MPTTEILAAAASLFIKAAILAAKWAGASRRRALESIVAMSADERDKELAFLRNRIAQLELQVAILRKHVGKHAKCPRYTVSERLHLVWFMDYFQIPRRRVTEFFGIARSTLYRCSVGLTTPPLFRPRLTTGHRMPLHSSYGRLPE